VRFCDARYKTLLLLLRSRLQTGTPHGNDRFRAQIQRVLRVKVGYSSRGRPKKPVTKEAPESDQIELNINKGF